MIKATMNAYQMGWIQKQCNYTDRREPTGDLLQHDRKGPKVCISAARIRIRPLSEPGGSTGFIYARSMQLE
jgi:hypothetical protein